MCTPSVSNVIYHKFSDGAASYALSGKDVNIMLESTMAQMAHFSFSYYFTILNSKFRIPKFALRISEFGIVKYMKCGQVVTANLLKRVFQTYKQKQKAARLKLVDF